MNKNRIFVVFLTIFSLIAVVLTFSILVKYKSYNQEENFKQYKELSNKVAPISVMERVLKEDMIAYQNEQEVPFVVVLSLLAAKYYGDWSEYDEEDLEKIVKRLKSGATEEELSKFYGSYTYFKTFYDCLFGEFVGDYKISKEVDEENEEDLVFEERYGLKAYSPIAHGYSINFCDDFDNEINFAKQKGHFGNDIAVKRGTPFVAVESGIITKCSYDEGVGRIELSSFDGKRKYIYCNCNEEKPFAKGIEKGAIVGGGQTLGFVGSNNCCKKGGAAILNCPYLHFAIQLNIKEKKQSKREVYVDAFSILKLLEHHKSTLIKPKDEYKQKYIFKDDLLEKHKTELE